MVAAVAGRRALSPALVERLVDRAEGLPLYLEELTRSALDLARNDRDGGSGEAIRIPDTIQDSLMARIDRIHPLREIVQVAALVGREFRADLLSEVTGVPEAELHRSLERLIAAAIISRRADDAGLVYSFEHALIRDALAEAMLRSQRRRFHGKIAEALVGSPERYGTSQPDQIGSHFAEADRAAEAVPWFMAAAQQALGRFANVEAVSQLNRAAAMVAKLPEGPDRARLELSISTLSGVALTALRGWASEDVGAAYQRAHELWQEVGQGTAMFPITVGLIAYNIVRGELAVARTMAEEALRMAEAAADDELIMSAEHELGATILYQGDPAASLAHLRRCVALYDPERHGRHVHVIGKNQCVAAHLHLGLALCALGEVEESIAEARRALAVCVREPHPFSHAFARLGLIGTYATVHDPEKLLAEVDPLLAMSEEEGFPHVIAQALIMKGWALSVTGRPVPGLAMIHQGLGMWRGIGAWLRVPFYGGLLADACLAAGDIEGGLAAVEQALSDRVTIGEHLLEAELFRLKGVLLQARTGDPAAGEPDLRRAIERARASGSRLLELRAATALGSLWCGSGREGTEARALLEPVLACFDRDADITDVRAAVGLLARLGPSKTEAVT
jgi:predicted ATPase